MTSENPASVRDYPSMPAESGRIEAAPRRVRGMLNGEVVFDTTSATYVWEVPYYPQYSIPVEDVDRRFLVDEHHQETLSLGVAKGTTTAYWSVQVEGTLQQDLACTYDHPTTALAPITGMVAFYNEAVDTVLDDRPLARPVTHFVD